MNSSKHLQFIFVRATMTTKVFVKWRAVYRFFFTIFIVILLLLSFKLSKELHLSKFVLSGTVEKEINEKINWNDYEMIRVDSLRSGFGEHGKGESLEDEEESKKNSELFETFGMSVIISDKISLTRSIPDFRHPLCMSKKYYSRLPRVSIVIIFNNEVFSVFKRTLMSLYNRTPHELIEEVILVNDNSTLSYLYDPLREFIDENFPDFNFQIINLEKRVGLMRARQIGAEMASSEYLFVMEPHCEMTYNWLPPLIEPLLEDRKIVTVPIIDNIEYSHMEYYENDEGSLGSRGVFDWTLEYEKLPRLPVADETKKLDPFQTPIMTGGVFMIRKDYFKELGYYDENFLIWGAENIELSLKINLCSGKLLEVPCSRIGHMFRAFTKWRRHESGINFVAFNQKRVVDVWFDEFGRYVYEHQEDNTLKEMAVGDLQKQKDLRAKLQCKPMKYFFDVVAPDLMIKFPPNDVNFAEGNLQLKSGNLCLTATAPETSAVLKKCSEDLQKSQTFELSWYRDLRLQKTDRCLDTYKASITQCHLQGGNQLFKYDLDTQQIKTNGGKMCLEGDSKSMEVSFVECNDNEASQKWKWSGFVKVDMLKNWKESGRTSIPGNEILD